MKKKIIELLAESLKGQDRIVGEQIADLNNRATKLEKTVYK